MAPWRSGDAADCKSVYPSSILGGASKTLLSATTYKTSNRVSRTAKADVRLHGLHLFCPKKTPSNEGV